MEHTPAWLAGLWQRTLLTTSGGRSDASTMVLWLQTANGAFADLRIPADLAAGFPSSLVPQDERASPPAQRDKVAVWQRLAEQEVRRSAMRMKCSEMHYECGILQLAAEAVVSVRALPARSSCGATAASGTGSWTSSLRATGLMWAGCVRAAKRG